MDGFIGKLARAGGNGVSSYTEFQREATSNYCVSLASPNTKADKDHPISPRKREGDRAKTQESTVRRTAGANPPLFHHTQCPLEPGIIIDNQNLKTWRAEIIITVQQGTSGRNCVVQPSDLVDRKGHGRRGFAHGAATVRSAHGARVGDGYVGSAAARDGACRNRGRKLICAHKFRGLHRPVPIHHRVAAEAGAING